MLHPAILLTCIELPSVLKTLILSIFEWPFKTGFTVYSVGSNYVYGDPSQYKIVVLNLEHHRLHQIKA